MSRIELIVEAIKEGGRIERMQHHPHNIGCDGKGDIELLSVDRDSTSGPLMPSVYGKITRCTSCGYIQKTGTLINADVPEMGGGYYF